MLFQSMAAQHRLGSALKHLFIAGKPSSRVSLKEVLRQRYDGHTVELYSRGRAALSEAIRVAADGEAEVSVAITAYTCFSVEQAVLAAGMKPVYLDIDPRTIHFDGKELARAVKEHKDIKVVVVQNNLGVPADMVGIEKIARKHDIRIVEDLAHAAGTSYDDGREAGTVGDVTMLSFGKGKSVDTVNGGAVVVRNTALKLKPVEPNSKPRLSDRFRDRVYPISSVIIRGLFGIYIGRYLLAASYKTGWMVRSAEGEVETNRQLPNWQARLALTQLIGLDEEVLRRQKVANRIIELFDVKFVDAGRSQGASLVRVPFLVDNRKELLSKLKQAGLYIEDVWYDTPLSPERYQKLSLIDESELPKSKRITASVVNFPTHRNVRDRDIYLATKIINEVVK